jgi:hypothetical protein
MALWPSQVFQDPKDGPVNLRQTKYPSVTSVGKTKLKSSGSFFPVFPEMKTDKRYIASRPSWDNRSTATEEFIDRKECA